MRHLRLEFLPSIIMVVCLNLSRRGQNQDPGKDKNDFELAFFQLSISRKGGAKPFPHFPEPGVGKLPRLA